ncbi:MAG: serine/threonine protein kinase, partial [Pseudomonadales bacterium]|nr:serine/threonine protein kinase [Pseudomonadales bacterium]
MSNSPPSLESLFTAAVDLPVEERKAFLDRHCPDQPELRKKVEELLDKDSDATSYFDDLTGAIIAAAPLELESAVQTRLEFGPYKAHQVIGRGGMGIIYEAERVDGEFDQQVALKLLHVDMETPETHSRFLAERQLLARLSHPNIARLLDGGVTPEGRPYFVMELVDGMPIATYCREHALPVEEILRLFLDVVDAVSYLHRNLIVHRDLKPGNIFVDQGGQVKLLDFGIAKILTEEHGSEALTRTGLQLLTPEYAAPEQLRNGPITTATDVFALGGVLYELLSGGRPFNRDQLDINDRVLRTPTAPSTALRRSTSDVAAVRNTAVSWRRLAGDLDNICLKALRPEPEFRYVSAEQLGEDIERHLNGLPVRARKNTAYYRSSRFLLRHRSAVAATMMLLTILGFGFAHERGLREEAEVARLAADHEAARALAVSDFLTELLSSVDPAKAQGHEVPVA